MRTVSVLVLFFFFSFFGLSQQIEKIDVNPVDPYDISYPRWFTKIGNAVLFSSLSCEFGDEPWRFDGSTSKVLDIIPGEVGSEPVDFNLVNSKIYFRAKIYGSSLFGLYMYDELLDSAVLVSPPGWTNPSDFVEFNSKLYCVLSHPSIGNELWEIDGYSNYQVTNNLESFVIMDLSAASNGIYFCGSDAMGYEPWFYDGFSAVMLADINSGPNSSWPSDFVVVNDTLFFLADDGLHFEELWRYDGMNASLVQDINPLASSMIENIFTDGSSLFFRAYDPLIGNELRVLENGILLSFDNNPGIGSATPTNYVSYNGSVLFMMNDGTTGNEMWKYENGVVSLFSDINPGSAGSNFNSDGTALVIGGDLYFTALQAGFGYGLYRTDGASVTMEPDFNGVYNLGNMRHNGNEFLFSGGTVSGINELWKYDGVTYTMIQVNFSGTGSSASYLTLLDDTLYFGATDGVNGIEPYAYDGTSVISLGNTNEFSVGADIGRLDTLNGSIYFLADISPYGEDFWLYDGVNASIVVDTNIVFSIDAFFNYDGLLNNEIIFSASQIGSGYELWGFDGASIYQILDISAGPSNGFPDDFIQFGEDFFFLLKTECMAMSCGRTMGVPQVLQ
jgi:ELWxxDGT repeat protein